MKPVEFIVADRWYPADRPTLVASFCISTPTMPLKLTLSIMSALALSAALTPGTRTRVSASVSPAAPMTLKSNFGLMV